MRNTAGRKKKNPQMTNDAQSIINSKRKLNSTKMENKVLIIQLELHEEKNIGLKQKRKKEKRKQKSFV